MLQISSNLIIEHIEVSKTVIDIRFVPFAEQKRSSTQKKAFKYHLFILFFPFKDSLDNLERRGTKKL